MRPTPLQNKKEETSNLRPKLYPRSITFRLTKGWREYIIDQANTEGTTLT